MHDTCSDENVRLRLVCRKSDTVTEPPPPPPADTAADGWPPPVTLLDVAELSLSASAQLPGDMLTLPATAASLGDTYDICCSSRVGDGGGGGADRNQMPGTRVMAPGTT